MNKKIATGFIWRFAERSTAQLVSFVVSIFLARILMPEDYGIIAIVNVFLTVADLFVTSGLGTALIQKKDANDTDFSTIFWVNISLALFIYFIIFILSKPISLIYKNSILCPVLRVFGLRLPISAINSVQNAYISRKMEFKKFFFSTIIGTVVSAVVGIYMALHGFGVWSLIAQYMTNTSIDTLVLFITIKWRPKLVFSKDSAKSLSRYGFQILLTELIGTLFNQVNSFIIGLKYTSSDLAYYSKGTSFPDLINSNVGISLSTVLFSAMSLTQNPEEIRNIRRSCLKTMEYIMFPLMFGMAAVADKMIIVLLTEKWAFSIPYVRIGCIAFIVSIPAVIFNQEIKAIGKSDVYLKIQAIKTPIYLIIILIAVQSGVRVVALTLIINEIIDVLLYGSCVKKYIGLDISKHIKDAIPNFALSIIMCFSVFLIGKIVINDLMCLILQIVIGALVYIVASIISRNESFLYCINFIRGK